MRWRTRERRGEIGFRRSIVQPYVVRSRRHSALTLALAIPRSDTSSIRKRRLTDRRYRQTGGHPGTPGGVGRRDRFAREHDLRESRAPYRPKVDDTNGPSCTWGIRGLRKIRVGIFAKRRKRKEACPWSARDARGLASISDRPRIIPALTPALPRSSSRYESRCRYHPIERASARRREIQDRKKGLAICRTSDWYYRMHMMLVGLFGDSGDSMPAVNDAGVLILPRCNIVRRWRSHGRGGLAFSARFVVAHVGRSIHRPT